MKNHEAQLRADFHDQGRFTICVLQDPVVGRDFVGAAKCSSTDIPNRAIGDAIAHGRAMCARAEYYAHLND